MAGRRAARLVGSVLAFGAAIAPAVGATSACGGSDGLKGESAGALDSSLGSDARAEGGDAAQDATVAVDATGDVAVDVVAADTADAVAPDSAFDGSPDAPNGVDAAFDARQDTSNDAATLPEASVDASVDAGVDSGIDAGQDASPPIDGGGVNGASVLQHHKNATRDGFYVEPLFTKTAVTTMHLVTSFNATTTGQTFSQPLFMEGGVNGKDAVYVATEANDVFALDPTTGALLWAAPTHLGTPAPLSEFCGGTINPLGSTGTPVIDASSRHLYVGAMTNAGAGGTTPKQMIYSIAVDTGAISWSLDVSATIAGFDSTAQNQRGALALVGGKVFVPYGGHDCGSYKGWVVGVPVNNPTAATAWATASATGPGIWGPSGVASDGTSIFVATGNTNPPYINQWPLANSQAIIKLSTAPAFSGSTTDYFAPTDWLSQDTAGVDLASTGVVLFDAPGVTPTHLAFAIGEIGTARIADRANLGGISNGVSNLADTSGGVQGSLFAYKTTQGAYVGASAAFPGCNGGDFSVLKVSNTAQLSFGWCAASGGSGGPISSSTSANGSTDSIVWSFGAAGDGVLRGWDADTGTKLVSTGAVGGSVQHWTSPIIAKGRVYVAGDGAVYAFTL